MDRKKSVCIIRSNPVRPDSRVEKEAWSLANAGYKVHILAWDRDCDVYEAEEKVKVSNLYISITRLGHKATYGEGFRNIKSYLAFQFHMRKWLKKHKFDVIHACDFDTAFFSISVAKSKSERFVFDIFDFLYDEPQGIMQKCVKKIQYRIIEKADATIICTEERKKQIFGSKPQKLCVIHNTPFYGLVSNKVFDLEKSRRVKIAYVGILQDYRLLKEVSDVISRSDFCELHIGGFGKYQEYFQEMSKKFSNIKYYGRLTYDQTLALEKACDVMLAIYDPKISNHRFAAPNKFYESLMLGKPLIMARNTGMSDVLEENDIGILIDYSKAGFENGLRRIIEKREKWIEMGVRMKKIYKEKYNWEIMECRLLNLYKEIAN